MNIHSFSKGTQFKVKGDASTWETLTRDDVNLLIKARNLTNGYEGNIRLESINEILNISKANIPSENIRIIDDSDNKPSYEKIVRGRKKGRKKSKKED